MPKPKGGLGRGLNSLIPGAQVEPEKARQAPVQATIPGVEPPKERIEGPQTPAKPQGVGDQQAGPQSSPQTGLLEISVDAIATNPHQPRSLFDEDDLEELAASIRLHGVLQPLVVAQADEAGRYNLIAGERRWRASRLAGLDTVPVIVKGASPREMLELALVENLQRADLRPLEAASAYRSLVEEFGLKQEDVAARVGKSRGAVTNSLRLLRLPAPIQEALAEGTISEGHARALLQVPEVEAQLVLAQRIIADGLNVRQVESLARRLAEQPGPGDEEETAAQEGEETPLYDPLRTLEDSFRNALGTKVQLSRSRRGGRLVIYFYSDEELDRIYGTIVGDEESS